MQVSTRTRPFTVFSHDPPCDDREWAVPSGLDDRSLRVRLVLAQPTAMELLRGLAYPTFRLEPIDRDRLLEDLLPWCESWGAAIPSSRHRGRDPHDQVVLDLDLAAATPVLVSGDADLLALKEDIVAPEDRESRRLPWSF